jgi:hypothetical protein
LILLVQRYLVIVAILGATLGIGMVTQVQAQQPQIHTVQCVDMTHGCGQGCDFGYHWNSGLQTCTPILNPNSSIQQPTIKQIEWACQGDPNNGPYDCHKIFPFSSPTTRQLQQTSINCVKNDDGSWTCSPDAFTQHQQAFQPTIIDQNGHSVNIDCVSCENGCGCYGSSLINQPTNCFWSHPVQCN